MDDSFFLFLFHLSVCFFLLEEWKVDLAGFCLLSFSNYCVFGMEGARTSGEDKIRTSTEKKSQTKGAIALDIGGVFYLISSFSSFLFIRSVAELLHQLSMFSLSGFVGSFNCCSVLSLRFCFVAMYAGSLSIGSVTFLNVLTCRYSLLYESPGLIALCFIVWLFNLCVGIITISHL